MSRGTDFRKVIAWFALAVLAAILLLQVRRAELAGLRVREAALARQCGAACAADVRERVALAEAGLDECVERDGSEAADLMDQLRRLRSRIADLEAIGW